MKDRTVALFWLYLVTSGFGATIYAAVIVRFLFWEGRDRSADAPLITLAIFSLTLTIILLAIKWRRRHTSNDGQ